MKVWSVAVRPTPEEVKAKGLYYDKPYYDDRTVYIAAATAAEAEAKYKVHPQLQGWLCPAEKPYVRAVEYTKENFPDNPKFRQSYADLAHEYPDGYI